MTKRKSFLMILAMVLILPFAFMLSGCFGNNNNDNNNPDTPLPEGYYRITVQQTTGGSVNASKSSAQEGEEITLSYTTNNGYLFVKVTVKDSDNQEVSVNNGKFTMPASDVTVSATFERASGQKYFVEINFDVYGEIELVSPSMEQFEQSQGKISAGTRVVLRYEMSEDWQGYEFKSWNIVDTNGNSVTVTNNSFIMPNSNVTVSAVVGEKTYTVSVDEETARMLNVIITNDDDNDSVIESGSLVKYATRISLSYEFKEEGYTFGGWKDQNGQGLYNPISVNKNLVISANINAKEYSLTVDNRWNDAILGEGQALNARGGKSIYLTKANGQRINPSNEYNSNNKGYTGEEITIHCETINQNYAVDYYILTYYLDGELHNEHITTNKFNMLPESVKVSVQLRLVENTYNINYVLGGGTVPPYAPRTFKSTDNTLAIPNPTREGYRFDGWEEQESMSWGSLEGAISLYPYEFTEDLTLTAKWIKIVKINYVLGEFNGMNNYYVTNNNPKDYAVEDRNVALNNASHQYADFYGWYTRPDFANESKITSIHYENIDDINELTLYAKFETRLINIQYKCVSFAPAGRIANPSLQSFKQLSFLCFVDIQYTPMKSLADEDCVSKVTIDGYEFKGFYTSANCLDSEKVTELSFNQEITVLYAKQELQEYTITFVNNYGPTPAERTYTVEDNFDLPSLNSEWKEGIGWLHFKYWDYTYAGVTYHLTHINPSDYARNLYLVAVYGND